MKSKQTKPPTNGARAANGTIQRLIELQAIAQTQIARSDERMARADERAAHHEREIADLRRETDDRFARIEQSLAALVRMLERLPDAIREKIGFAAPAR